MMNTTLKSTLKAAAVAGFVAAATLAQAAPATYTVDPTHTFAYFEQSHFNTSMIRGRFDKKEGTIQLDKAARSGRVELTLDMTQINTGVAALDKHLQTADFFDSANHPQARFVGDKFVFNGEKVVEVSGLLTLRGQTHPLTLKAVRFNCYDHPMLKREVCGGDFEATLKRSLWGVNYGLTRGVADDTRLTIQVEAVHQP